MLRRLGHRSSVLAVRLWRDRRSRVAVPLSPEWLQRLQGLQGPVGRERNNGFGPAPELAAKLERPIVKLNQTLDDWQPEPGSALGRLMRERTLPKRLHDPR